MGVAFNKMTNRTIIGLTETIIIFGANKSKKLVARVDTGATKSSIDIGIAEQLGLEAEQKRILVKSAHGARFRPVIKESVKIAGKRFNASFTLADRSNLKYKVLIGQNILKMGEFLIDPLKK
ncbi:hypothetical protein COV11_04825 [Candidatus Woesearchaeota archaeon CG10_big_fil_rev_8_21_14_0_10_30_7]|nr:MAG: hypothetical protein COV11_04825 [Candidatus Woesearchaeota archaeon CG10_big_fil_rev_8_21_14_0_10_30_7]